jgi:hypothetical protein
MKYCSDRKNNVPVRQVVKAKASDHNLARARLHYANSLARGSSFGVGLFKPKILNLT